MGRLKLKKQKRDTNGGFVIIGPKDKPPKGRSYLVIDQQGQIVKSHRRKGS